jgi:hypothetical protein
MNDFWGDGEWYYSVSSFNHTANFGAFILIFFDMGIIFSIC